MWSLACQDHVAGGGHAGVGVVVLWCSPCLTLLLLLLNLRSFSDWGGF